MDDIRRELVEIKRLVHVRNSVLDKLDGHHKTLYGDDGRGGLVGDYKEIRSGLNSTVLWLRVAVTLLVLAISTLLGHALMG